MRFQTGVRAPAGERPILGMACLERNEQQEQMVALTIMNNKTIIIEYTDQQALEDGVLVAIPGEGGVNRVTRAVFDHFTQAVGSSPITGSVTNVTSLMDAIRAVLHLPPDEGGWRTGKHQDRELWLVPNEVGGLTLMLPEDY